MPTNAAEKPATRLVPVKVNRESRINIAGERRKDGTTDAGSMLFLYPGINYVPEERWASAKKVANVMDMLHTKIPPANAPEESPERVGFPMIEELPAVESGSPLISLTPADAIRYVAETLQVPVLEWLLKCEHRADVLGAIRTQIDRINTPKREAKK